MLEAVQCQNYIGIKLTMKSGKGSLPVEYGNHCWENVIMIAALKSTLSYCSAFLHKWRGGWQIHLKAIFDISMCHPKVPYHYTFIMTTSRKKSQKFTQTNSKRPSKVKEAGSCLTERRANRVIHFFLTNAMWQRYISKAMNWSLLWNFGGNIQTILWKNAWWCEAWSLHKKRRQYIVRQGVLSVTSCLQNWSTRPFILVSKYCNVDFGWMESCQEKKIELSLRFRILILMNKMSLLTWKELGWNRKYCCLYLNFPNGPNHLLYRTGEDIGPAHLILLDVKIEDLSLAWLQQLLQYCQSQVVVV